MPRFFSIIKILIKDKLKIYNLMEKEFFKKKLRIKYKFMMVNFKMVKNMDVVFYQSKLMINN